MRKRFLEAGRIVSTQGIKGEIRIMPWCNTPDFLTGFKSFFLDEGLSELEAESVRVQKSLVIMKLKGIDSLDQAVKLVKKILYIDRDQVSLPEGAYFEQDLLGLTVIDKNTGKIYGQVSSVSYTGANDVYGVTPAGGREVLIPAIPDVVQSVDLDEGKMFILPLKGLFDDED